MAARPRLVSVVVPRDVYAGAQTQLHDLRVMDAEGREVPYVLDARKGLTRVEARITRLGETSFAPGQFTQVVLDIGKQSPFHNALRVMTPEEAFITWVEVAVSDDAREWRIVRERGPIFRFRKEGREGDQTIRYSETNARYIRLRFLDGAKQFRLTGAEAAYDVSVEAELVPVVTPRAPDADAKPQQSWWRADLGAATPPIAEVRFEVEQPEFHRAVYVSASDDGKNWELEGKGEIYRFRQGDKTQEWLRVGFSEAPGQRFWRVEVMNGNDPPLAGARPTLYTTPRHVVFRQEPGQFYRLLYGQSEAKAPQYELGRLVDRKTIESAVVGTLGAEEVNTAYADPRPWTEQHPVVLWLALGIAVVALAFSALRALRRLA